jgi:hypothetical protein
LQVESEDAVQVVELDEDDEGHVELTDRQLLQLQVESEDAVQVVELDEDDEGHVELTD